MKHLTSEQMCMAVVGEADADEAQHLQDCPDCNAELSRMQDTMAAFRDSAHGWAHQYAFQPSTIAPRRRLLRWAFVAAAFTIAAVIPAYNESIDRRQEAAAVADRRLLEQVDAQLSRAMPASIEQLVDLLPENNLEDKGELQ